MIKIPFDLYNQLLSQEGAEISNEISPVFDHYNQNQLSRLGKTNENDHSPAPSSFPTSSKGISDDEKWLLLSQEFKRLQKLRQDREEKPINVRIKNIAEIISQARGKKKSQPSSVSSESEEDERDDVMEENKEEDGMDDEEGDNMDETGTLISDGDEDAQIDSEEDEETARIYGDVMQYIGENMQNLGVNKQMKVLRKVKGRNIPLKTSDIGRIIRHHLVGKAPKVPTGYGIFMERAKEDEYLWDLLFGEPSNQQQQQQQQQHGSGVFGFRGKSISKEGRSNMLPYKIHFRPKLW
jgi:hypothetical protein